MVHFQLGIALLLSDQPLQPPQICRKRGVQVQAINLPSNDGLPYTPPRLSERSEVGGGSRFFNLPACRYLASRTLRAGMQHGRRVESKRRDLLGKHSIA